MLKPKIIPELFSIEFHLGFDPHPEQQDAIFYTGMGLIATIKYEGFSVDIYCDGETRANLLKDEQGEVVATLYSPSDFIDAGIDTDVALRIANEQHLLDWINNSWFDMYCYGEHLDCVSHELNEAIEFAKTYVSDEWANTEMFMS